MDRWTTGPEFFKHLAIDWEECRGLPLHWRQALAEVAFREGDEDEALKQFIWRLDMRDIEVLEKVAKYAVGGGLLDLLPADAGGNPAREITTLDIIHLRAIGIIDSRLPVNHRPIPAEGEAAGREESAHLNWLFGRKYALHLVPPPDRKDEQPPFRVVTESGMELVEALRRPTSLNHQCWPQHHYGEQGMAAEIWSVVQKEFEEGPRNAPVCELADACGRIESVAE